MARIAMGTTAHFTPIFKIKGRRNQRNVRKGLGKISDQPPALYIVLLREQTHIVAQLEQTRKQLPRP